MEPRPKFSEVAILAGGMGTRLKSRTGDLPKVMAPICGKPVLEHQIALCRRSGFTKIALLVHYAYERISDYFGTGERWGVSLDYRIEQEPRGTAGALHDALPGLAERFMVLYGDTFADVDLGAMMRAHAAGGAAATLLLHPNDHPQDSDLVELSPDGSVAAIHPYPHETGEPRPNLVNAALYALERDRVRGALPGTGKADLAKHSFPKLIASGQRVQGYVTPEYIKDMGTPDRIDKVERDYLAGIADRLSGRSLRQAVFLDRDGTINKEVQHLKNPGQLELLAGVGPAIRQLNRAGMLAVCITNQPVVARGDVTWDGLARIHATLDTLLGNEHAYLDRLYVCPHHPDRGFEGEVPELKIECSCRKPKTGMIDQAVDDLSISRRNSWMVGDTTADIRAGKRAGLRTILVRTGFGGRDMKYPDRADYEMEDLPAAIAWALNGHTSLRAQLAPLLANAPTARLVVIGGEDAHRIRCAAQIVGEVADAMARTVRFLPLNRWSRGRGTDAANDDEIDFGAAADDIYRFRAGGRHWLPLAPDFLHRDEGNVGAVMSIGPDDLLVVEGEQALIDPRLRSAADVLIDVRVGRSPARPEGAEQGDRSSAAACDADPRVAHIMVEG